MWVAVLAFICMGLGWWTHSILGFPEFYEVNDPQNLIDQSEMLYYLELVREARTLMLSVVEPIEQVGDIMDWREANETSRTYNWSELSPLRGWVDKTAAMELRADQLNESS